MAICQVCDNSVGQLSCPQCNYTSCSECCMTFFNMKVVDHIYLPCINFTMCDHHWEYENLINVMDKKYINGLINTMNRNYIINREKQLIPDTQAQAVAHRDQQNMIERYKHMDNKIKQDIAELKERLTHLNYLHQCYNKCITKTEPLTSKQLGDVILQNYTEYIPECDLKRMAQTGIRTKKIKFIHPCVIQSCRGWVDDKGVCQMCSSIFCVKCLTKMTNDHVCDENVLQSIDVIKRETKLCPQCKIPIYKIDGCSQMWCVKCHTPFDWNSGKVITGMFHNPHFTDYMMDHGISRDELNYYEITRITPMDMIPQVKQFIEHYQHIQMAVLPEFKPVDETKFTKHRINYILGNMTEQQWITNIVKLYNSSKRDDDIRIILQQYVDNIIQLLITYQNGQIDSHNVVQTMTDWYLQTNRKINLTLDKYGSKLKINFESGHVLL